MNNDYFVINKSEGIQGTISVKGAKNAVLKVFAATLLSDDPMEIHNVPAILDIEVLCTLMRDIGCDVEYQGSVVKIKPAIQKTTLDKDLVSKIRASVLLAGPILARTGEVMLPHPGGDAIGKRPIDFFIDSFKALGAQVKITDEGYHITAPKGLQGTQYYFEKMSHTGTESLMITAVLATGVTVIENAACEPEVVALAEYLNKCGARIEGAGTHTITITGVDSVTGDVYTTIPDRLEAGTFAVLGALCAKELTITDCNPHHLHALWKIFDHIGVDYRFDDTTITVRKRDGYRATNIMTHEYPGFATDLQSPVTVLLTQCEGTSLVHDPIFDGRLYYTDMLHQMGASIVLCDPHRALITGPAQMYGRRIVSPDLRAGMALVLAGMIAEGTTQIENIYHIDRGYEDLETRLQNIGVHIERHKQ